MEEVIELILAIDPGTRESAFVLMDDNYKIYEYGKTDNTRILQIVKNKKYDLAVIEMVECYGQIVGREVFDTVFFAGRIAEASPDFWLLPRRSVKMNLCNSPRAKDANVRRALIDRFAKHDYKTGKGTVKEPDVFYGVTADVWQAIALGVTYFDLMKEEETNMLAETGGDPCI